MSHQRNRGKLLLLPLAMLCLVSFSAGARADELLDEVLHVMVEYGGLDPAIRDAGEMLDCLIANNGDAAVCFNIPTKAEKQAGKASAQFMPDDPKIQGVIDLVFAVQKEQWLAVFEIAGLDILSPLICENAARAGGPVGSWFCSGPFKDVIANYAEPIVKEAFSLINNGGLDLGSLLELVALLADLDLACSLIPDEISGVKGACSLLGQIIAEIGGVFVDAAKYGAKIVVAGADEVENLIFGDDSHMSYDQYYALYWLPWLHKSVNLCITANCAGGRDIRESIWDRCVDYFDSHNQYRSTAEKTCDDLRDKRYHKATNLLAEALLEGARSYVRTIHAGARAWAITEYGKNSDSAIRSHFLSLCETELEQGYPLTSGTPAMCDAYKNVGLPGFQQFYKSCMSQVAAQQVSPTAWRNSCKTAEPEFVVMLQTEKQALQGKLSNLAAEGCAPPQGWSAQQGLRFQCQTYAGFDQCLTTMVVSAGSICSVDRSMADAVRAKEILAFLGQTRCSLSGTEILCHRPWKHTQCQQLVKSTAGIQLSKTSLACKEDSLEYYKIAFANQALLDVLNAPVARGGQNPACNWIEDKAKISCLRIDILEARLAAKPELQRPVCKTDPNYDGADTSCYLKPYNVKTAPQQDTVSVSSTAASTLQQPGGTVGYDTPYQITGGAAPDPGDRSTRMTPASAGRSGATTIGAAALPTQVEAAPNTATARTAAPALRAMNAQSNETKAPPNPCSMDVTYYVPKPPIIESSSPTLQVGHQVQIQCGFEKRTRQLEWQQCDDEAKATMSSLKFSQETGSRYSGMMIIDDANIGIATSPLDGSGFDNTGTWIFNEAGSHEVTCQVDNGLHIAGTESPVYLQAGASVRIGGRTGTEEFRGFDPGTARRVTTTVRPDRIAPVARDGRIRLSGEDATVSGNEGLINPALNPQPEVPSAKQPGGNDMINPSLNPQPEVPSARQPGGNGMINPSLNPQPEVPSAKQPGGNDMINPSLNPQPEVPSRRLDPEGATLTPAPFPDTPSPHLENNAPDNFTGAAGQDLNRAFDSRDEFASVRLSQGAVVLNDDMNDLVTSVVIAPLVIEVESLISTAVVSAGEMLRQEMAGFGPGWGGDAQLFWRPPAPSGSKPHLLTEFQTSGAGMYELILQYTTAPDFGQFTVYVDGSNSTTHDGFSPQVGRRQALLGRYPLASGRHELAFEVTGKNQQSTGYIVGVDRLQLTLVP